MTPTLPLTGLSCRVFVSFVPKSFLTAPLVRDVIVADILPSLADEEQTAAMDTEDIKHIHLSGYRIMVQTIRSMIFFRCHWLL